MYPLELLTRIFGAETATFDFVVSTVTFKDCALAVAAITRPATRARTSFPLERCIPSLLSLSSDFNTQRFATPAMNGHRADSRPTAPFCRIFEGDGFCPPLQQRDLQQCGLFDRETNFKKHYGLQS